MRVRLRLPGGHPFIDANIESSRLVLLLEQIANVRHQRPKFGQILFRQFQQGANMILRDDQHMPRGNRKPVIKGNRHIRARQHPVVFQTTERAVICIHGHKLAANPLVTSTIPTAIRPGNITAEKLRHVGRRSPSRVADQMRFDLCGGNDYHRGVIFPQDLPMKPDVFLNASPGRNRGMEPGTFRVATYNVENYLDDSTPRSGGKSVEARAAVRATIRAANPDVLALQEMGQVALLLELRAALKAEGLDYPHWEHVAGSDETIHLAILSRFPFAARRSHTDDCFELAGRSQSVRRGFAEVDVQVNSSYRFTLLAAHLKSKHAMPEGEASAWRLAEATVLRAKIDKRLAAQDEAKIIVLGDFNDVEDSTTLQTIRGAGPGEMFDPRPTEGGRRPSPESSGSPRPPAWTAYWKEQSRYERIDYLLISRAMRRDWVAAESTVLARPDWQTASDHRLVSAAFRAAAAGVISG